MNRNFPSFLLCLLLLAVFMSANPVRAQNFRSMMRSEVFREGQKKAAKSVMNSFWNGKGSNLLAMQLLNEKEVRDAWGVSDEQHQKMQASMMGLMTRPEFAQDIKEMQELHQDQNLFDENGDKDKQKRFLEIQAKMMDGMMKAIPEEIDKTLTTEQKKKVQEFQLAAMSDIPLVTPDMFKALDLNEGQTKKMEDIRKELGSRFDKMSDEFIDAQMKVMDKIRDAAEKEPGFYDDMSKVGEKMRALSKKMMAEDPEIKALNDRVRTEGRLFVTELKMKMFDVLTDEQWARLEKLVDHPPEYVRNLIRKMKENFGDADSGDSSKAFMEAWKPGEPIPEEYRQQRKNKGFPQKEAQNEE